MKYFLLVAFSYLFLSNHVNAEAFYAKYGEQNSGFHNSPHSACLALNSLIYPNLYSEELIGVTGLVDATHSSSCSTQYSYRNAGNVYWVEETCNDPDELGSCKKEIVLCEDGLPEEIGDYFNCDRPDLKKCLNGSIIKSETEICETVCFDFDTCHAYATSSFAPSCESSTTFDFNYTDPDNWSYSCTTIDIASPDHLDNGGNSDGNTNNDPLSPEVKSVSEVDVESLANAIDAELQNDFGNVERAVRDSIDSSDENSLKIVNKLDEINSSLKDQNETPAPNTYTIPSPSNAPTTIEAANQLYYSRISQSPIVSSFSNMKNFISLSQSQCPKFEIELPAPINSTVSTLIHCELYDTIRPILSPVMMAVWIFFGFRVFAST
jgi:hypothetical protein